MHTTWSANCSWAEWLCACSSTHLQDLGVDYAALPFDVTDPAMLRADARVSCTESMFPCCTVRKSTVQHVDSDLCGQLSPWLFQTKNPKATVAFEIHCEVSSSRVTLELQGSKTLWLTPDSSHKLKLLDQNKIRWGLAGTSLVSFWFWLTAKTSALRQQSAECHPDYAPWACSHL